MRRFKALGYFYFILVFLNICFVSNVSAETVETHLSRQKIALGEYLTISYTWHDSNADSQPDFSPLEKDFKILSTNYGNAIRILNGVTQAQRFWQITLEPKSTGELIIPAIEFGNAKSSENKLVVLAAAEVNRPDTANLTHFVQAEVDNKTPYVQSQVHYIFKLFYQSQLENASIQPPQVKDAVLMQIGRDNSYQTTLQGKTYFVYEKHFVFFPQKTGKLNIEPAAFHAVTYDVPSSHIHDPFVMVKPKAIKLETKPFAIDVKPIPDQFTAKTWLPANNVKLTENWSMDLQNWEEGTPVIRNITLEAEGLRADQIPDLDIGQSPGVNVYSDPPQRNNNVQGDTVIGILQQKITYIPTQVDTVTLSNIELPWWNTKTNKPDLAQLKSNTIVVKKTSKNNNTLNKNLPASLTSSIEGTAAKSSDNSFYTSIWFWLSIFLLLVWIFTLLYLWKRKRNSNTHLETPSIKLEQSEIVLSERDFIKACAQDDALTAQRFLLAWAVKLYGKDAPYSLAQLSVAIQDEKFKIALGNLEQTLYASKKNSWNGRELLTAYRQEVKLIKRMKKFKTRKNALLKNNDVLPPLNP